MKKLLPFFLGCLAGVFALAQELWLSPQRFYFTIRDIANIRFLLGSDLNGKDLANNERAIRHLVLYDPAGGTKDLAPPTGNNLQLSLREEGTYMVVCNTANSRIAMDLPGFNNYLHNQGLKHIHSSHPKHKEQIETVQLYEQYSIKTIFQVGGKITDDCLRPSLLPLDILPQENPYALEEGTNSDKPVKKKFLVLFNGQPLNNALVKRWYRGSDNTIHLDSARTNRRGLIAMDRYPGPNLLTCSHMERNDPDTETQWQTYQASLSFEYSRFFPGKPQP